MKWIGQHIYDNISRFRSDVYLESISSGTIASGGNLGLDSNNKIVKAAEVGSSVDLTSEVTGTLPVANGGTGATSLASTSILTGTGTSAITANSYLKFSNDAGETDTSTFQILSNQDTGDLFKIDTTTHGATTLTTTDDDAAAAHLTFSIDGNIYYKTVSGTSRWYKTGNDDDYLNLTIGNNGDAAFTTVDAAAAAAHITFQSDGDLKLTPGSGTTYFYDSDNASDYLKLDIDGNGGATFATVDAAAANAGFTINADGLIELNPTGGIDLTDNTYTVQIGAENMALASSSGHLPKMYIQNATDDANSGSLIFVNRREDGGTLQAGEDSDVLGEVSFMGFDDAGTPGSQTYANIQSNIADATSGQEAGNLVLQVASYDGVITNGLQLLGDTNADGEVDVTIASGAASTTTIAGDLTISGDQLTFASSKGRRACFEFSGYATADGSNYMYSDIMSGNKAPFLHDETTIGSAGTTADNPAAFLRANGTVMPYAGTLKMWKGWGASAGSATIDVSIFKYTPTADDATNDSLVLVKNTQFTAAGNDNLKTWSETSFSITVAAGDILLSAIKGGTNNKAAYFVSTLEIEWTS